LTVTDIATPDEESRDKYYLGLVSTMKVLPVEALKVNDDWQRPLDVPRAERIAARWDDRKAGALMVSYDPTDDKYTVVDGQHRLAAAKRAGVPYLCCVDQSCDSSEEEAELFERQGDDRRNLTPYDRHRAALYRHDLRAVGINNVLMRRGLSFARGGRGLNRINTISAVQEAWNIGGEEHLGRVLDVIGEAWPHDVDRWAFRLIRGVSGFLSEYPDADTDRLVRVLAAHNPRRLCNEYGMRVDLFVAYVRDQYNRGLRRGALA